jgi:hypothetical protein
MNSHASASPSALAAAPAAPAGAATALLIGAAGIALTLVGFFVSGAHVAATAWLVGVVYWTAMAIGMLMLVLIHHIFDAEWSVVIRRQFEHGLAAFPWLGLLFLPLVLGSWFGPHDLVWPWMSLAHVNTNGETVASDLVYAKKAGFLNLHAFTFFSAVFFAVWIWLSCRLRKASFSQDFDGDVKWTLKNRFTAGMGLPLSALALTFAAVYWVKSLEYHWFSTMFGVWFFANCMRGALSLGVLIMLWLYRRGDYRGILKSYHLYSIGQLMFAFTVFWGYISFSQYFLIWNANVPEETFWYNIREHGDWWYVGMFIVFGTFLAPFLALLSYRFKVTHHIIRRIALWILMVIFVDISFNLMPALKDAHGDPQPFLSINLLWSLAAVAGVGGVCVWAYLRSFATAHARLIPIRDPRIAECLAHHD